MTEHSIRMSGKRSLGALLGTVVLFGATSAPASPEFPAELQEAAGMDCKPACTICHTTNPGSAGTADQSFAITMVDAGLLPGKPDTVVSALDEIRPKDLNGDGMIEGPEEVGPDSDEDGTTDVNELTAEGASDPSAPGVGAPCAAEVRYGCAAGAESSAPRDLGTLLWPLLLAAVGLGVWARRRTIASPER